MEYNAANIKLPSDEELLKQTPWLMAGTLANEYDRDQAFIERGIEACQLAGESVDYFINRYLKGDRTIPENKEVSVISMELQKQSVR